MLQLDDDFAEFFKDHCVKPWDRLDDENMVAIRECAQRIAQTDDTAVQCVYAVRICALLQYLTGQPVDHGDHLFAFKSDGRAPPP